MKNYPLKLEPWLAAEVVNWEEEVALCAFCEREDVVDLMFTAHSGEPICEYCNDKVYH